MSAVLFVYLGGAVLVFAFLVVCWVADPVIRAEMRSEWRWHPAVTIPLAAAIWPMAAASAAMDALRGKL